MGVALALEGEPVTQKEIHEISQGGGAFTILTDIYAEAVKRGIYLP